MAVTHQPLSVVVDDVQTKDMAVFRRNSSTPATTANLLQITQHPLLFFLSLWAQQKRLRACRGSGQQEEVKYALVIRSQ